MTKETSEVKPTLEELAIIREQREAAREARELARWEREESERFAKEQNRKDLRKREDDKNISLRQARLNKQARCNHRQGQLAQRDTGLPKYALFCHRLPNGEWFVGCIAGCGMKWYQNDTREWLEPSPARGNKTRIPNHTGKAFTDMYALLPPDSTSLSEMPLSVPQIVAPAGV
jgi:hypothetical protein